MDAGEPSLRRRAPSAPSSTKRLPLLTIMSFAAVAAGVALRLSEFLQGRSFSRDETFLALNIIDRSFSSLFQPLDFNQGAPIGFLASQKLIAMFLGTSDQVLRLFPLTAAVASVWVFYVVAREMLVPAAVPLATGLFAVADPLLQYASSSKQYGVDVFVTLVASWAAIRVRKTTRPYFDFALLAAIGGLGIWFSHASVFVLAGILVVIMGSALRRRDPAQVTGALVASCVALGSFSVFAVTALRNLEGVQRSLVSLPGAYSHADFGSGTLHEEGTLRTTVGAFRYITGVPHILEYRDFDAGAILALIAICIAAAGLVFLAKRSLEHTAILVIPLAFMVIAWSLHRYPVLGRTQLFLVPSYLLLLSEGFVVGLAKIRAVWIRAAFATAFAAIAVVLAAPALGIASKFRPQENMKPAVNFLAREQRPEDTLFVYYTAQYGLRYYLECQCAGRRVDAQKRSGLWAIRRGPGGVDQWAQALLSVPPRMIVARYRGSAPTEYLGTINALKGRKRVWILLSGATSVTDSERKDLVAEFNRLGVQRTLFRAGKGDSSAVLYLYDFTGAR